MDYVEGQSIDDYCDRYKLSIEERLRLFRTVCGAVQHAHQIQVGALDQRFLVGLRRRLQFVLFELSQDKCVNLFAAPGLLFDRRRG